MKSVHLNAFYSHWTKFWNFQFFGQFIAGTDLIHMILNATFLVHFFHMCTFWIARHKNWFLFVHLQKNSTSISSFRNCSWRILEIVLFHWCSQVANCEECHSCRSYGPQIQVQSNSDRQQWKSGQDSVDHRLIPPKSIFWPRNEFSYWINKI